MAGMGRDAPVQWRDPDLHEVIEFLQNPNAVIKANAAAYLQVFNFLSILSCRSLTTTIDPAWDLQGGQWWGPIGLGFRDH